MENSKFRRSYKIALSALLVVLGTALILLAYFLGDSWQKAWNYLCNISGAAILLVGLFFAYSATSRSTKKLNVRQMTLIAVQSSITVVLYYFVKFKLPFFPPWLDVQVSEIPALITGFAYGPYAGCLVILIRFIVKLPATITAGVGELGDLVLGITLVWISSAIYGRKRDIKGALIGTLIGVLSSTVLAMFVNWLVLIPAYIHLAHLPLSALVGMMNYIPNFTVTESNFMWVYIFIGVLPFNLFRYVLVAALTFLLYKKTHFLLDRLAK